MLESRLPQVHVGVDEAGGDQQATGVEDRRARCGQRSADTCDLALLDEEIGDVVERVCRVDDAPPTDEE